MRFYNQHPDPRINDIIRAGFATIRDHRRVLVNVRIRTSKFVVACCPSPDCEQEFSPNHITEYEFGTLAAHVVPRHNDTKKELRRRFPDHDLEFLELPGIGTSGYARSSVPRSVGPPNVRNKYRAYVTLTVPENGSRIEYPWERGYHGVPKAGSIVLHSFEEEIFHLAAHEAAHIQQFADGVKISERRAEKHAQRELKKWKS